MSGTEATDGRTAVRTGRRWSRENWLLIGLFTLLTVAGVAISTGVLSLGVVTPSGGAGSGSSVRVPVYVYLYASLGALGYVFTKLMTQLDSFDEWGEIEHLAEMGLRIPAAWVLAAGIYLLSTSASGTAQVGLSLSAGVSFLVGLYVNVALKSLGSLADRILGRGGA
jgi:hypothetical protein